MTDRTHDTRNIPDEPEYWVRSAERAAAAMAADRIGGNGIAVIARSRWWVPVVGAAAIVAAAIVVWVFRVEGSLGPPDLSWQQVFATRDALSRTMIASREPPQIPALLFRETATGASSSP